MVKNILVVDDSALMRRIICDIINTDNRFKVADIAKNGAEAFELLLDHKYDVVICDINMPKMTGLELLERLQKYRIKAKVIMVSTLAKEGAKETILALELGAFDFVTKPENFIEAKGNDFKQRLMNTLEVAAMFTIDKKLNEVIRPSFRSLKSSEPTTQVQSNVKKSLTRINTASNKIVALACSTGGPKSLQSVIPLLPKDLNSAVLIVQHMPAGFTNSLAQRLDEMSKVKVKEATEGEVVTIGCVYIAPGGFHMRVVKEGANHKIKLTKEEPIGGLRPCANILYESLTESSYDEIVCVVLTGMGADGTNGIKKLSNSKPVYVIAQDEKTCVVYGMPKTIAEAGLVDEVVPLDQVSQTITKNVGVR
ncbi:protein-glutamate methylesterase/protein-glutamine glutaminase [Candidatus Galacturonibacter soehngenii]|uniref:Protein-glutamate methylesterase/protein-glutamine glutaminase n=1 Tax=Candidatus Galacturonatibacter soehngenii TaxID=2307010 RepID=A0A7V7UB32_9FIRM|nr:chemotaxis response regulator protein-glutamate methylesterase [Candidatus Galacturonibacter soehngenii]KAB1437688.1 chemotaxis response regulator protein-glutamate methylesterase [Candidatus Galacturonibacter soehngenii]